MCDALVLEERVDTLEDILGRFIVSTDASLNRLSLEMRDFKDEMRDFKEEAIQDRKNMNRQWGNLANKMGTLVEDIVAPAVRPAVRRYFGCDVNDFMISRKRKNRKLDLKGEFDVIAVGDDRVFVVETKSSPSEKYLHQFAGKTELFRKLFPEYTGKHLTLIFASLRFDEDIISLASREGVYVLAYREWDYMDILNFEAVELGSGQGSC